MALRHAAALALTAAFVAFAGAGAPAIELAQTAQPAPPGNVMVNPNIRIPKEYMPDLTVIAGKVTASCVGKKTVTAVVTATVKNVSPKGSADLSKAAWNQIVGIEWASTSGPGTLDGTPGSGKSSVGGPNTLPPGGTVPVSVTFTKIPRFKKSFPKQGQYGFAIRADHLQAIAEADENNNGLAVFALDPCYKL